MDENLKALIEHERQTWNDIYQKQINDPQDSKFSSFWWEYYYLQIKSVVMRLLNSTNERLGGIEVLEVGSGTGKASLFSLPESQITLLDLAENGFFIAEKLAEIFNAKNVKYVTGDMFSLPFPAETYDFVWNIGTLEHYDEHHIKLILSEMFRVTRYGGVVAIAIPNHNSLPMLKARLLGSPVLGKYFKWVPGYRADSEKNYSAEDLFSLFETIAQENNFILKRMSVNYIGSPHFVCAGKIGVLFFKPLELLFPKAKFLTMISGEKAKE